MSRTRPDRSIQSANTPTPGNMYQTKDSTDTRMYRCMVLERRFVDDALNITKNAQNPQVLYEVIIIGGEAEGQIISNVRMASWLGGDKNFQERVLKPIDKNKAKDLSKERLSQLDGDIVYVIFGQGNKNAPFIIGLGTNPQDGEFTGAKEADGTRYRQQYNGVFEEVNKDGEFSLIRKGGEYDSSKKEFIPPAEKAHDEKKSEYTAGLQFLKDQTLQRDSKKIENQIGQLLLHVDYVGTGRKGFGGFFIVAGETCRIMSLVFPAISIQ